MKTIKNMPVSELREDDRIYIFPHRSGGVR
jgi:molybdopterin converting factor small subunit